MERGKSGSRIRVQPYYIWTLTQSHAPYYAAMMTAIHTGDDIIFIFYTTYFVPDGLAIEGQHSAST